MFKGPCKRLLKSLPYGLITLFLSGCTIFTTPHYEAEGNTNTLEGLTKVHAVRKITKDKDKASTELRLQSIRDYAFSIGAQKGCAMHTRRLQELLDKLDKTLDRVYNFNVWMLPHNVLPPVLVEAKQAVNLMDTQTMRLADRSYHIYKDARFVTTPPHWRYDYLLRDAAHITDTPPKLVVDLLPKTKEEQAVWKEAVKEGWRSGILQARNNFMINLHTLERDLNGIVLYRQLLAKQIVSAPYVAHSNLGITGDEKNMHIQDQILKITMLSKLKHDTNTWKPVIINQEPPHEHTSTPSAE